MTTPATSWTNPTPGSLEGVWGQPLNDILDAILVALQRLEIPLGLVATDDATAVAGRLPNIAAMRRLVLAPDPDQGALEVQMGADTEIINHLLFRDPGGAPAVWVQNAGGIGANDRISTFRNVAAPPPAWQADIYGYVRRNGSASFAWPGPPGNLLTYADACQEVFEGLRSGTIGSWQMVSGGTIALVAEAPGVQTPSGAFSSLRLTATGTSMQASTAVGLAAYPVTAGQQYSVVGHTLAMDTARSPQWGIRWYDAAGTYLSQSLGTATAQPDVDTWTLGYGAGLTAPAGAAWAAPTPVFGTTAVGERHRVAGGALFPGTVTVWAPPFVGSGTYAVWGEAAAGDTWEDSAGRQRYVCTTGGIPAAQVWTPAGSGVELSDDAPLALGAADPGATGEAADAGHVHPTTGLLPTSALSSSTPAPVGTSGSAGVSTSVARADHAHAAGGGLGLAAWRQGLGNRLYGTVNVVAIGSSTTAGNNATALARRYVNQLGSDLHTRYNAAAVAGGAHILGVDSGWTYTGTHGTDTNGLGLQSVTLATSATMGRSETCTGFDVYYAQGPGAGAFTVSIDGAAAVTVTPDTNGTAARHDGVYSSPTVTSGSHSILITASAATVINSVYARGADESAGVRVYNSGLAGANAGSFYGASAAFYQRLAALNPRLVLVMLGANDYSGQTALATFSTQMQGIVDRIVGAVTPTPSILMVGTYRRLDVTGVPTISWQQYLDAMAAVAAANPGIVEYVDISAPYPTTQEADQSSLVIDPTDYIHQTDRGHRLMSDLLTAQLTAPASPAAAMPAFDPRAVGGLLTWLDAGTLALSNNVAVSSWSPRAGIETAALAQATSGNRPVFRTNRVNGRPSVAFTAANSHNLDSGTWAGKRSTPLTVISIARMNTGNVGNLYSGRSGVYAYAGISTGTTLAVGAGAVAEVTQSTTMDTWHVIVAVYNGASSAIYVDSHTATATGTTSTGSNSALPGLRLGTNSGASSNWLDGEIADVAVWTRALTAAEITALTRWYGTRYGITVA